MLLKEIVDDRVKNEKHIYDDEGNDLLTDKRIQ